MKLRLQYLITIILGVFFVASMLVAEFVVLPKRVAQDIERQLINQLTQLQRTTNIFARRNDHSGVLKVISASNTLEAQHVALVANENGKIVASTDYRKVGLNIWESHQDWLSISHHHPTKLDNYELIRSADGKYLIGITPLMYGNKENSLRPSHEGLLLVCISIAEAEAIAASQYENEYLHSTFNMLMSVIIIWLIFHFLITRRLEKLNLAATQFTNGETGARVNFSAFDEIGTLGKTFNHMADEVNLRIDEARLASRSKDEFLASMSHELRTPLTSIIGHSDQLLEDLRNGAHAVDSMNIVKMISSAGRRQLALVNDILDMSKIETGKFPIEELPYDLNALLKELHDMFDIKAKDAGIKLVIQQATKQNYLLMGDSQRIGQILINLLGNAIKFTAYGQVTLLVRHENDKLIFTIKDTGIGMSKSVIANLFSPFAQADSSISKRFGGTGLGLYISKKLAKLMQGDIKVSSIEGVGSVFELTLPYQPTSEQISTANHKQPTTAVINEKITGHVLIAEDTPELQFLERRILESIGLTVTIAENGQQAVDLTNSHQFDLILMDMQMPIMDGIEATHKLREQGHELPIIALTANVMEKHRQAFTDAGCNAFVGKPINKKELMRQLKFFLGN